MTGNTCFGWFHDCKKAKTQFSMTVFKLVAGFDLCLPVSSPLFYVWFMMLGLFLREFKRGNQGLPAVSFGSKDQRIKGVKKTHRVLDDIIPAVGLSPWQGELPGTNLLDLWGFFVEKNLRVYPMARSRSPRRPQLNSQEIAQLVFAREQARKLTFNGVMPHGSRWHELMIVWVEDVFRIQV